MMGAGTEVAELLASQTKPSPSADLQTRGSRFLSVIDGGLWVPGFRNATVAVSTRLAGSLSISGAITDGRGVLSIGRRGGEKMMKEQLAKIDRAQQGNERLAVAAATVKKYGEDQSSSLASTIAFWAFFSIFPLFLVLVTILGYVLPADRRGDVLGKVASFFPLLHPSTVGSLSGSWWPIVVGGLTAFWAGSAVVRMMQQSFDEIWEIPRRHRPGLVEQVRRSLFALATIGFGLVVATIMSGYVTGRDTGINLGWYGRLAGYLISLALDVGLFVVAFRILTTRDVTFRDVLPGALLAGIAFFILQLLSSVIISRYLGKAQGTYGSFATVITILWWFYLQAQITLLGAQLNVVLVERLYPRSLVGGPETEADERVLQYYADKATFYDEQEIRMRLGRGSTARSTTPR